MIHENSNEQLMEDLQSVIHDAENLLTKAGAPGSEEFISARERIEATVRNAKEEIVRLEEVVLERTREAAQVTDNYVKDNPWQAVGLGAAVGLVIGLLISRK